MAVKIENSSNGRILKIRQTVALWIRLIGVPFFLFGFYILSIFFYSVYQYLVYKSTLIEWLYAAPGLVLTLFFAVLFMAPGAYFMFSKLGQTVICDFNSNKITSYQSLLPWKKPVQFSMGDYNLVKIEYVARHSRARSRNTGSGSEKTHCYFEVNLLADDGSKLHLASFLDNQENQAIELARRIGRSLGINVEDNPWNHSNCL